MFVLMVATAVIVIWAFEIAPLTLIATQMFGSIDKFALMAIPFFIFGATVMGAGGLTTRLVAWVESIVGWIRGGLAMTTIATCEVFGTVSGSSAATTAAVGSILYPPLVKNRYGETFSLGLVTCTGAIASVIPPSIGMIVYSAITGASVGAVFMGGVGPGILLGLCFAGWVVAHVYREKVPSTGAFDFRVVLQRTKSAGWALGMPILILGGIYSGIFTPTEASAVSTIYAMFVALVIYREMTLKKLFQIAIESGLITAKIMIIIASSGVFVWILTVGGVPDMVNSWVKSAGASQFMVLMLINIVFLIAGMFLEPNSTLVVLTPLFYPIATGLGVDPVHLGDHTGFEHLHRHVHSALWVQHLRQHEYIPGADEEDRGRTYALYHRESYGPPDHNLRAGNHPLASETTLSQELSIVRHDVTKPYQGVHN